MPLPKRAIIIFARKPELGKVKTRLAAHIGEQKTLQIYIKLLEHTRKVAKVLTSDCHVFLTELTQDDFWKNFFCEQQVEGDLGEKMENAFEKIFAKGYNQCIIVGSDCPDLKKEIIENAFEMLSTKDIVIGPAEDGGYYLLGMKKLIVPLFHKKDWSTDLVFKQTINDIETLQLTYELLPILNDVDEVKDVPQAWLKELEL